MMVGTGSAGDCGSLMGGIVGVVCFRGCRGSGTNRDGVAWLYRSFFSCERYGLLLAIDAIDLDNPKFV